MASKIFIIAGEASGDAIGAKLIKALRAREPDAQIFGIGGKKMEAQNFQSIFPMQEISLIGFAEILPHLSKLLNRLKLTETKIREIQPDIIVTIDSPGFNFRIIKKLQDIRTKTKFIHYVAPTVWAYKPERAAKIAKLYDHLLVILPFEPAYFEKEGLATTFIGHPITEDGLADGDAAAFKTRHNIDNFICMMPGSRRGELTRNLPTFKKIAENMAMPAVIIAADYARELINISDWKTQVIVVDNKEKADCFAASTAGIIKSGTSALEYAFANKPYVVIYKVSPISHLIIKSMIKIPYANLLNILADKLMVPELLQYNFTAEKTTAALKGAIKSADLSEYRTNLAKLNSPKGAPSAAAAEIILNLVH